MRLLVALASVCLLLSGCLGENAEELDRLIKEDPAFKQMIAARDEARRQIHLIKQELLNRKNAVDAQVEKLRGEYDTLAKGQHQKIEQFRLSIEANRDQLKRELELAEGSLESKLAELAGYRKTLADVRKVLAESKGITLSKAERQKWEERILMLSEKMRPLSEEIQDLRLTIRLKKQKIGFLQ
jgi:hypothetical protein